MRKLESVNLTFGASENAPNALTYNQAVILTKLAESYNAGLSGRCSGWIRVDSLYKSQYVLLRNAGLNIASPAFENCFDDSFKIDSIDSQTIYEGHDIELKSDTISNDVLVYSMNPSTDIRIISKSDNTDEVYIRSHIHLRGNKIVVDAASKNDSWTAEVTVHATPKYSYIDNEGNAQSEQGATIGSVLRVVATAVEKIKIEGPIMINMGQEPPYSATPIPENSTKEYTRINFTSKEGGFANNSNIYKINTTSASDTITATMILYGQSLTAELNITLGVELMNDTNKNPQMFGIIKSALGLDEDVHSFSVVDAMEVDNDGADAIFTALKLTGTYNQGATPLYSFTEFQYFTSVTQLFGSRNTNEYRDEMLLSAIVFPDSLKRVVGVAMPHIEGDFNINNIVYWQCTGRGNCVIGCTGNLDFGVATAWINASEGYVTCNTVSGLPASYGHSTLRVEVNNSAPFDLSTVRNVLTSNVLKSVRLRLINADTVIVPIGVNTIPVFGNSNKNASTLLKYFRVGTTGTDSVNLPVTINSLMLGAFENCINLEINDITYIKTFDGYAFKNCVNVKVQSFGSNILDAGYYTFDGCEQSFVTNRITIPFSTTTTSISAENIGRIKTRPHIVAPVSNSISSFVYSNATNISGCWFDLRGVPNIASITLQSIDSPFVDLTALNRIITLTNNTARVAISRIYVPDALVTRYKAATNWNTSGIVDKIYGETQFKADVLATRAANSFKSLGKLIDIDGNEVIDPTSVTSSCTWEIHPYDDNVYQFGLPVWTLADDV